MPRSLILAVAFFSLVPGARSQDTIAPETVEAVKKATVFIRVEGDDWTATGSGFVISGDDKVVLIATNDHVAAAKSPDETAGAKAATITVVFDSGTKAERSYTALIAATDAERDLAILRVAGVKDPPRPIAYSDPPKLVETMPLYSFGFPFGKALSTTKGFPAITVGKASVSSLRNGPDGELSMVQIDGNLNPGNSGGPVVDTKGRLVGVAVATIRDGQGIGFAVPSHELVRMVQGRVTRVRVTSRKVVDGGVTVRVEADLLDPANKITAAVAHYFVVAPKAKHPATDALAKHPGSKKIELKIDKGVAAAEFAVPAADGHVLVQVTAEVGAAKSGPASRVRSYPLAPLPKASDLLGPPLPGWKVYRPRDGTFVMWVPEKPAKQAEEEGSSSLNGQRMRGSSLIGKTTDGLGYEAESVSLPPAAAKIPRKDLYGIVRGALVKDLSGRLTDSNEVTSGTLSGLEYVIEAGAKRTRVRVYATEARLYVVQVTGPADLVTGVEAEILLSSYRLGDAVKGATAAAGVPGQGPAPANRISRIVAGGADPQFNDKAPEGGYLVGFEVGIGKWGPNDVLVAAQPIYRVGEKESAGTQFGTDRTRPVKVVAKRGYAVGAISVKAGAVVDGFSVTFMKVVGGKLDPKDSYESEWVGGGGTLTPTKLGGDGTLVVGIVGRANNTNVTGLGLLYIGDKVAVGKSTQIVGGRAFHPEFRESAPNGGLLVGFEVGLVKWGTHDAIKAVRPIFREGEKDTLGDQYGTEMKRVVKVVAKPGYAVGAVTVKISAVVDFSVTFMKVVDGKLDPKDSYESGGIAGVDTPNAIKLGGDGTPVVGITGRVNGNDVNGLGLLMKEAGKK
ncbi:S1C family serine protease [Frigoriglobus tundricola]|uniref:Serine protease n=1 Tax=Frigoriglobus tundricola TaxID=2774151 RepID=A0A6M5YUW0_9BACT|nr:serine protease [Frigoriglobus tundricola]QJW97206.1 hypothetical protein FTUN_4773 [Frigoriglobus tundricola]